MLLKSFRRIFGCWHLELGRPFTDEGETYRVCLKCGSHQKFNPGSWKTVGDGFPQPETKSQGLATRFVERVLKGR